MGDILKIQPNSQVWLRSVEQSACWITSVYTSACIFMTCIPSYFFHIPTSKIFQVDQNCIILFSHTNTQRKDKVIYYGVLSTGRVRLNLWYKDNSFSNSFFFICTRNKKQFLLTMLAIYGFHSGNNFGKKII